jgi:hypothetical protein
METGLIPRAPVIVLVIEPVLSEKLWLVELLALPLAVLLSPPRAVEGAALMSPSLCASTLGSPPSASGLAKLPSLTLLTDASRSLFEISLIELLGEKMREPSAAAYTVDPLAAFEMMESLSALFVLAFVDALTDELFFASDTLESSDALYLFSEFLLLASVDWVTGDDAPVVDAALESSLAL